MSLPCKLLVYMIRFILLVWMDYYLFYTTLVSLESNEKDTRVFIFNIENSLEGGGAKEKYKKAR